MPFVEKSDPIPSTLGLMWLLRLRWFAVAGQVAISVIAGVGLGMQLPWLILGACIAFTAGTNFVLSLRRDRVDANPERLIFGIILSDIIVLTIMLYFTGGSHNPFTTLYILHITLAAILLPAWATWASVALCGACFGLLFTSHYPLLNAHGVSFCGDMDTHLQGMVAALVVTGAGVAYFVSKLSANLQAYRQGLLQARELGAREQRFASLATLAAGIAHELATPLGTIAVVSKDMERSASHACHDDDCEADARLIRQEVERCRTILGKLGEQARDDAAEQPEALELARIPLLLREYLPAHLRERLNWQVEPRNAVVHVPVAALLRALAILVKNGCEASEEDEPVHLAITQGHDGLTFSVRDIGVGMSPECIEHLGEPFFTTKAPGVGMGLGLFLVRTIVERLQGRWAVESARGSGTTIKLSFPQWALPA